MGQKSSDLKTQINRNVVSYVHSSTMCQFFDPFDSVVKSVPRVHLVSPVLVRPNETIEVRNLIFPMSREDAVDKSSSPRVPFLLVATALHPR